jgi:hypothetical protein
MQEDLLSPRLLVYGSKSSKWVCMSRSYRDSYLRRDSYNDQGAASLPQSDNWKGVVTRYTACQLSFKTDTLNAVAAIAEDYGNLRLGCGGDQYLAGLWRPRIEHLCTWWFTESGGNKRPNAYRAPSWSWASVDSTHSAFFKNTKIEDIIEVSTAPASAVLPYGNAESGFMKVHCKIACFSLKRDPTDEEPLLSITNADADRSQTLITNVLCVDASLKRIVGCHRRYIATTCRRKTRYISPSRYMRFSGGGLQNRGRTTESARCTIYL